MSAPLTIDDLEDAAKALAHAPRDGRDYVTVRRAVVHFTPESAEPVKWSPAPERILWRRERVVFDENGPLKSVWVCHGHTLSDIGIHRQIPTPGLPGIGIFLYRGGYNILVPA